MEKRWHPTEKDMREALSLWRRTRYGRDLILGDDVTVRAVKLGQPMRQFVKAQWKKLLAKYPKKQRPAGRAITAVVSFALTSERAVRDEALTWIIRGDDLAEFTRRVAHSRKSIESNLLQHLPRVNWAEVEETIRQSKLAERGYGVEPDGTVWWLTKNGKRVTHFDAGDRNTAFSIALQIT